jgi:hypothetical protein
MTDEHRAKCYTFLDDLFDSIEWCFVRIGDPDPEREDQVLETIASWKKQIDELLSQVAPKQEGNPDG